MNRTVAVATISSILQCDVLPVVKPTLIQAENGAQALDLLAGVHVDVVIMDLMMPVMDGAMAIAEMRKRGYHHPVIVLSAMDRSVIAKLPLREVSAILAKPIDRALMRNAMCDTLRLEHRRQNPAGGSA